MRVSRIKAPIVPLYLLRFRDKRQPERARSDVRADGRADGNGAVRIAENARLRRLPQECQTVFPVAGVERQNRICFVYAACLRQTDDRVARAVPSAPPPDEKRLPPPPEQGLSRGTASPSNVEKGSRGNHS